MWDKLPPTSLPSGELVINTSLESNPSIIFYIPEKSREIEDENGEFGIRKSDTRWEIYSVSTGEVIKESRSYSKFFDGNDWDPGTSELSGSTFTASKEISVTMHEKIDGTIRSAKDVAYKYPQIFDIEWSQFPEEKKFLEEKPGSFTVKLNFTIRKDIRNFTSSYSSGPSGYLDASLETIGDSSKGTTYQWSTVGGQKFRSGERISFSIMTDVKGSLETLLTYIVL